jgi:hypothetical protein
MARSVASCCSKASISVCLSPRPLIRQNQGVYQCQALVRAGPPTRKRNKVGLWLLHALSHSLLLRHPLFSPSVCLCSALSPLLRSSIRDESVRGCAPSVPAIHSHSSPQAHSAQLAQLAQLTQLTQLVAHMAVFSSHLVLDWLDRRRRPGTASGSTGGLASGGPHI